MAVKLNDNFEYYSLMANNDLAKGEFDRAEQYIRHARTMVVELRRLHGNKKVDDSLREMTDEMIQKRMDYF